MPWSFLNPWLWLGALALAAPVWLHLRRKEETNLFKFSALRFLDDQPTPRQTPLHLRDLLLFLLRVLAVLLIVAAFAWPYLRSKTAPIQESRIYILDNTMSHQANNGFQKDRDRIVSELNRTANNVQLAVIELAAVPRVLVSFGDDRQTAVTRLQELQPSFQRGSYLTAFRQAQSMLVHSLGTDKRIILLGDNQENQWNENVNGPPFLRDIQVELPAAEKAPLANLSLAEARAQRVFLGDKSLVNFTVKLTHAGPARNANIILRANGQEIFNRSIDLDPKVDATLLQAQWEADPANWVRGDVSVNGTPDALSADNKVLFSVPPVVEGNVALLAQSSYLRLALSSDIMRGQWALRLLEPSNLAAEISASQDADVLVIESNFLQSGDARKLLSRYLSNGRGVILLVNKITPAITANLLELGFEVANPVTPPKDKPEHLQFVFSNHPIFHPFLSPEYGNLMDIKLFKYFRLHGSKALPLAFSQSGAELFFQASQFRGKLFVVPFGLDRQFTSWPIDQTFIPFLDLALQSARAEDPTPLNFEPGEVAVVPIPPDSAAREVVLHDDTRELFRVPVVQNRAEVRLPGTPGLYTMTFDDNATPRKIFSVNPPAKESQLSFTPDPSPVVKLWTLNEPSSGEAKAAPMAIVSQAGVLQQRFWWWMIVGGLVMLGVEMLVTALKRRPETA